MIVPKKLVDFMAVACILPAEESQYSYKNTLAKGAILTFTLMFCMTANGISGLLQFPFYFWDGASLLYSICAKVVVVIVLARKES